MSDGKKWVKWWADAANDPKVLSIPYACRWAFPSLLLLAKKSKREGYLEMTAGNPYSTEALAKWCDIPLEGTTLALDTMCNAGILERVTGCNVTILKFTSWEKRQLSDSYARVKKHRSKPVTECNVTRGDACNGLVTTEVEVDLEVDLEKKDQIPCAPRKTARFTPPTIEEVSDYCKARGNNVNPIKFHAHYTANGWRVGKGGLPMKNWKAAIVSTWEKE